MLDAVWDYMRLESGQTFGKIWGNLERLRRLGIKYDDLPTDRAAFKTCLEMLLADDRVERIGELWAVKFPEPVKVERREPQTTLF
jgi:hypothetical protein